MDALQECSGLLTLLTGAALSSLVRKHGESAY